MSKSNLVDIEVKLKHESKAAWLVQLDETSAAVWVPKSMCELEEKLKSKTWVLMLPEWMAIEKGLV